MTNPNAFLADNIEELDKLEQVPTRDGYGNGVVVAGEKNANVVVLCADLTESTRSQWFKDKFPERFVEIGVAEQNMASVAAGMAVSGKIPFIASYATFSPGRSNEQVRTTIAYNRANVKIIGAHSGVSVGPDGATHQALEDIGLMRMLPGMTVFVPCDAVEAQKATEAAAEIDGPVYIRLGREKTPVITTDKTPFEVGKAVVLKEGKDVTIVGCGPVVCNGLDAAIKLEKKGISAAVINVHTVKPLDEELLLRYASKTGAVVTVEEHQVAGGLGGALAELFSEEAPVIMRRVGVRDSFGESGKPSELIEHFGMGTEGIMHAVEELIQKK